MTLADHEVVVNPPKTKAGQRVVSLDDDTVTRLRRHRTGQAAELLRLGIGRSGDGLVFADPAGQRWHPERVTRVFGRLVTEHDMSKLTLHGLRHTHATLLLSSGVNVKTVSSRLGHKHPGFTLATYAAAMPADDQAAAEALANLVTGAGR